MRRQQILQTATKNHVCILCSSRFNTPSARTSLRPFQRRHLNSSNNPRSNQGAVGQTEERGDERNWGWSSQSRLGPAQSSWGVGTGQKNEFQQDRAHQSSSTSASASPISSIDLRKGTTRQWKPATTSATRHASQNRSTQYPQPSARGQSRSQQPRQQHAGTRHAQSNGLDSPRKQDKPRSTAGWQHLRKRSIAQDDTSALLKNEEKNVQASTVRQSFHERSAFQGRDSSGIEQGKNSWLSENGPTDYVRLRRSPRPSTHVQGRSRVDGAFETSQFSQPRIRKTVFDTRNMFEREPRIEGRTHGTAMASQEDTSQQPHEIKYAKEKPSYSPARLEEHPAIRQGKKPHKSRDEEDREDRSRGKSRGRGVWHARRSEEDDEIEERKAIKRERKKAKEEKKARLSNQAILNPISLPEFISVSHLAAALKVRNDVFLEKMRELGFEDPQNDHVLNAEDANLIAMEYNFQPMFESTGDESRDLFARPAAEDPSQLPTRPPVVTIMGHVDHGKTTILDFLRKSSVAASEFGGITQHIGAFSVPLASGKTITFLDTPGHAAFLSMRQRGANVTDIVILVVAADDSVKPQTIEAIKHAQAAKVPIIVAISKIDKEDASPDRVKSDLARHGVEVEDFGGDTQVVCVSGKTGQGMQDLEESIILLSEVLDHRAETTGLVEARVLEASTKKSGRVATILVNRGTLRPGDIIVAGSTWARVRCLRNEAGITLKEAGPGIPAEVDGWRGTPEAGDQVLQAPTEDKASSVVDYRIEIADRQKLAKDMDAINEARKQEAEKRAAAKQEEAEVQEQERSHEAAADVSASGPQTIPFIVKADVSGSAEAVVDYISTIGNAEVAPMILRSGVGAISEFDVEHAATARGHIVSFNCTIEPRISQLAQDSGVRILDHNIIYRMLDDVKALLSEKLKPIVIQKVSGEAEISQIFSINLKGRQQMQIAGCKVRNGLVSRNSKVRVLRGKEVIYDGILTSLKNQKKDATEMRKGTECGIGFEDWEDFKEGDQLQCYIEEEQTRSL